MLDFYSGRAIGKDRLNAFLLLFTTFRLPTVSVAVACFLFFIFSGTLVFSQKYKSDSWASVQASGSGTLYIVYPEQQPRLIEKINGQMKGLCVDILNDFVNYVLKKYSKKIKLKYDEGELIFQDFLTVVQTNHNVLGVGSVAITEQREKILKYTPPFLFNRVVLITNTNIPDIKTGADMPRFLKGYSAEILARSSHEGYIKRLQAAHWPSLQISYGKSLDDIITKVSLSSKKFTVVNMTQFVDLMRRRVPVKQHPVDLGDHGRKAFIMSLQSDWDGIWNEFLTEEYRRSVSYRKHIAENLGGAFLKFSAQ